MSKIENEEEIKKKAKLKQVVHASVVAIVLAIAMFVVMAKGM